jgi:hypothetical protein
VVAAFDFLLEMEEVLAVRVSSMVEAAEVHFWVLELIFQQMFPRFLFFQQFFPQF